MDDLYKAFDDRAQVILTRLTAREWDLMVGVIESTDRVQHMMWRLIDPQHPMYDPALAAKFGGAIASVYRRADTFIGEVMDRVEPGTPILVVSDHGFHSWRKAVNLNTWLVQNGYIRSSTTCSGAARSRKTSTGREPARTRWASARSTSTCAAGNHKASSALVPKRADWRTNWRASC
jgi:predicted AlkP superfamily phosphohydrolase/phosphomutase